MVIIPLPPKLEDDDDSVMYTEDEKPLPSPKPVHLQKLKVTLHPTQAGDQDGSNGLIVKITPPQKPENDDLSHVPCDVVLVIDVSSSMGSPAPVPTVKGQEAEDTGLSVLDLVKHASHTILETLGDDDRLGIVTFDYNAQVLQTLQPMTKENKVEAAKNIDSMKPTGITNLWKGILYGLELFKDKEDSGRVPAVYVLTDGVPNHQCPSQGYVPKLRGKGKLPAAIHTFGFGYTLKSGLLKSIAEIGGGSYAFIPDAGMIGTVFVHAVANLQSTFANHAKLMLKFPSNLSLEETVGQRVDQQDAIEIKSKGDQISQTKLTINLGNIQYGQSRDIYLECRKPSLAEKAKSWLTSSSAQPCIINATVEYAQMGPTLRHVNASSDLRQAPSLSSTETAYHISRSRLCAYLASLFPPDGMGEHIAKDYSDEHLSSVKALIASMPASQHPTDPLNASILADLGRADNHESGQIIIALSKPDYFSRWGRHYLLSLLDAHTKQVCNSFKDPGPLQYGKDSPLFIKCRERLDEAFDMLPSPEPSLLNDSLQNAIRASRQASMRAQAAGAHSNANMGQMKSRRINMRSYNSVDNPCFAGFCSVELADGRRVRLGKLRRGMEVATPRGGRRVVAVLKTRVRRAEMVRMGGLVVTPWHPVKTEGRGRGWLSLVMGGDEKGSERQGNWVFPARSKEAMAQVRYTGSIYSVLLERDDNPEAHAVKVGGVWGVTLGHGLTASKDGDVRAHAFLGNYDLIVRSLAALGVGRDGVVHGGGIRRDGKTGRVCGFRRPNMTPREQEDLRRTAGMILRKSWSF